MKKATLIFAILTLACSMQGQSSVKAVISLKDGKKVDVFHFGKLICESNRYANTFTTLRGKYSGIFTEIADFSDISKLVFSGFTAGPVASRGNQKGSVTVIKKNGTSVPLEEAELVMSCFNPADRYNEIHVQIMNPLTDKAVDLTVEMRNIESITF
jgi:hypothetical protein